jgi:peptidase M28-like protein
VADDDALRNRALELIQALCASPRFAGSPGESNARAICKGELERAGLQCLERPFEYSQWPGKWGIPVAAAVQLATILVVSRMAVMRGPLIALLVGGALYIVLILASADAKRRWVRLLPIMRASAVNLEARRGAPHVWLVAHLDSKAQTVPMLIRIASAIGLGVVTLLVTLLLLLSLAGLVDATQFWPAIQLIAVVVSIPSILCFVRNQSAGALDNATGVVTVLLAASALASLPNIGVLITSGEELGLAGARVWALTASAESVVLNCDTVDDSGQWRLMYTGERPREISAAIARISSSFDPGLAPSRMIPGILADSMAFSDKGIEAVTLSRGTISTLARIHTRRDTSIALSGSGVAEASRVLAALTRELS